MTAAWLPDLLTEDARAALRSEAGGVATTLPAGDADAPSAGRLEGLYGALYDRAIQDDRLRRLRRSPMATSGR